MVSVIENAHQHKPLLVQAPVRALDPDGVAVVSVGTAAFAISTGILWTAIPQLIAADQLWHLWVAATGTVMGVFGLSFGIFRSRRRKRSGDEPEAETGSVEDLGVDPDRVPDRN
ncbi:uncharacterized protein DUF2530 [Propionicimonas paludicola]|uniref:Uncharacterized protein DUF2530 n=1 Tax=Propionicimonas paludicola TaxID=185243 RepID=A0A2A9CV14_9ACTN|nr:uncharacterized protein DUF2530 [Propionicimonas paludicola]